MIDAFIPFLNRGPINSIEVFTGFNLIALKFYVIDEIIKSCRIIHGLFYIMVLISFPFDNLIYSW